MSTNIGTALVKLSMLIQAASTLTAAAERVSAAIQRAQAEGRDLSDTELDDMARRDDEATAALEAAIAEKRSA